MNFYKNIKNMLTNTDFRKNFNLLRNTFSDDEMFFLKMTLEYAILNLKIKSHQNDLQKMSDEINKKETNKIKALNKIKIYKTKIDSNQFKLSNIESGYKQFIKELDMDQENHYTMEMDSYDLLYNFFKQNNAGTINDDFLSIYKKVQSKQIIKPNAKKSKSQNNKTNYYFFFYFITV